MYSQVPAANVTNTVAAKEFHQKLMNDSGPPPKMACGTMNPLAGVACALNRFS
jgi:hypothetical protein